jgi:hypothetical protein
VKKGSFWISGTVMRYAFEYRVTPPGILHGITVMALFV